VFSFLVLSFVRTLGNAASAFGVVALLGDRSVLRLDPPEVLVVEMLPILCGRPRVGVRESRKK
jgi:hypothetical protein